MLEGMEVSGLTPGAVRPLMSMLVCPDGERAVRIWADQSIPMYVLVQKPSKGTLYLLRSLLSWNCYSTLIGLPSPEIASRAGCQSQCVYFSWVL